MKRFSRFIAFLVTLAMVSNIALADVAYANTDPTEIDINIDNPITVTATGGNSHAQQGQEQNQGQQQGQEQKVDFDTKRPHIIAQPGPSGNFMSPIPLTDTEEWTDHYGSVYTVERLTYIKDSASFFDRPGLFSAFTSPVKRTLHMKQYDGEITLDTQIKLVDVRNCDVVDTLGVYKGTGAYGWPMEAILAYTLLQAKRETNAHYYAVKYKVRKNPKVSGLAVGSGAASSVLSGSTGDNQAKSLSVGAVIGASTAYLEYAFDVEVRAVEVKKKVVVVKEKPCEDEPKKAEVCSPSYIAQIKAKIERLELQIKGDRKKGLKGCPTWKKFNMEKRIQLGNLNLDLYACTKDEKYLHLAIYHFEIAERNYYFAKVYKDHSLDGYVASMLHSSLKTAIYVRDKGSLECYYKVSWVFDKQWHIENRQKAHADIVTFRNRVDQFSTVINP